jgi:hypothetical protein
MSLRVTGRVWLFGDNLNTDAMYPAFAMKMDPPEAAKHVFYQVRPGWTDQARCARRSATQPAVGHQRCRGRRVPSQQPRVHRRRHHPDETRRKKRRRQHLSRAGLDRRAGQHRAAGGGSAPVSCLHRELLVTFGDLEAAVSYRQFLAYVRDWLIGVSPSVCVRDC